MIASLAMYDSVATAAANGALWSHLRERLLAAGLPAPADLTRGEAAFWPAWQSPDLILSQTCGYPYRAKLHDRVSLVGAPITGLPDAPEGHYYSVFLARAEDPRECLAEFDAAAFIWNEDLSQSGWAAPVNHAQSLGLRLRPSHRSGAHRASAAALRADKGELAALDAVTWAMMEEDGSAAPLGLKVVAKTPSTPALPFITATANDADFLRSALSEAIAALTQGQRDLLHLHGIATLAKAEYLAVPSPAAPADLAAQR